ncbi:MAG: YkgJ family cysteine cluster protein [Deltaproteobacteria bacterium]|nr:YkgJ family cysteine cluster protein [Deltaproteobacteria bacterium]
MMEEMQRLTYEDTFCFLCHKGVRCFTECCRDLDVVLTPYDIIRLKNGLGIGSGEFLARYTGTHTGPNSGLPVVNLRMSKNAKQTCPFVTEHGCTVYNDRPGACRSYPIGRVAVKNEETQKDEEFFLLVREPHCFGFEEQKEWKVKDWLKDQEIGTYNRMNDLLMEVISQKNRTGKASLNEQEQEIFYTACYDLDRFRTLTHIKDFPENCRIEPHTVEKDTELMQFALKWISATLFGV